MRYNDIIKQLKESYESDIEDNVSATLMLLKVNNVQEVPTEKVLASIEQQGIAIGVSELLDILHDNPIVKDANENVITFNTQNPDEHEVDDTNTQDMTVSQMAQHALNKRMKD